jgi:hypothetical protein
MDPASAYTSPPRFWTPLPGLAGHHAGMTDVLAPSTGLDVLARWRAALLELTADPMTSRAYLDAREAFNVQFASELLSVAGVARSSTEPALYAVWIGNSNEPYYVGQTQRAGRRLWDLPFGESHHLANSFPPQSWSRVVVLCWARMEAALVGEARDAVRRQMGVDDEKVDQVLGLGLEHAITVQYRPFFNLLKRRQGGGWIDRDPEASRARGARAASLQEVATLVEGPIQAAWSDLVARSIPGKRRSGSTVEGGVFLTDLAA